MNNVHNIKDYVSTPWGFALQILEVAPGITCYITASHGGLFLTPEVNALVPLRIKMRSFLGNGFLGWYEEDVDARYIHRLFEL
jgi:hypothetical protein